MKTSIKSLLILATTIALVSCQESSSGPTDPETGSVPPTQPPTEVTPEVVLNDYYAVIKMDSNQIDCDLINTDNTFDQSCTPTDNRGAIGAYSANKNGYVYVKDGEFKGWGFKQNEEMSVDVSQLVRGGLNYTLNTTTVQAYLSNDTYGLYIIDCVESNASWTTNEKCLLKHNVEENTLTFSATSNPRYYDEDLMTIYGDTKSIVLLRDEFEKHIEIKTLDERGVPRLVTSLQVGFGNSDMLAFYADENGMTVMIDESGTKKFITYDYKDIINDLKTSDNTENTITRKDWNITTVQEQTILTARIHNVTEDSIFYEGTSSSDSNNYLKHLASSGIVRKTTSIGAGVEVFAHDGESALFRNQFASALGTEAYVAAYNNGSAQFTIEDATPTRGGRYNDVTFLSVDNQGTQEVYLSKGSIYMFNANKVSLSAPSGYYLDGLSLYSGVDGKVILKAQRNQYTALYFADAETGNLELVEGSQGSDLDNTFLYKVSR